MRNILAILALITMATAITVSAEDTNRMTREKAIRLGIVKPPPAKPAAVATAKKIDALFNDKEWSVEASYTVRTEDLDKYRESVTIGGNYFLTKGAGFHAAIGLDDLDGQGVDLVEFGFVGRVPFEKLRLALQFGIGAEHRFVNDGTSTKTGWVEGKDWQKEKTSTSSSIEDSWAVYAEAGPVWRVNKYFDLFAKVRGIRPIDGAEKEHIGIFFGAAVPFRF